MLASRAPLSVCGALKWVAGWAARMRAGQLWVWPLGMWWVSGCVSAVLVPRGVVETVSASGASDGRALGRQRGLSCTSATWEPLCF